MTDTISFTQQQGVATLCFDNPSRRNALGAAELDAIEHALGSLSAETRVLVVTRMIVFFARVRICRRFSMAVSTVIDFSQLPIKLPRCRSRLSRYSRGMFLVVAQNWR